MLRGITTGSVQNLGYSFDPATGNLLSRRDNLRGLTEVFGYDNLNRLTSVSGPAPVTMTYAANGNIQSKTSVGSYTYGTKPHAVTSVTNPDDLIPSTEQRISYTSFNKADSIIQGNYVYTLSYGVGDQRTISRFYDNGVLQKTVYYAGAYEKEVTGTQVRQLHYTSAEQICEGRQICSLSITEPKKLCCCKPSKFQYIYGGDGLAAIYVSTNGWDSMYYVHADHLGSYDVITNKSGQVVQRYSFDAWGRRRNPDDWTYTSVPTSYLFSRGYTGQEHLDQFGLINFNGRIYDPVLGRFLGPDPYVQDPFYSQDFNRYSYCLNNPLAYIDPSGYSWWSHFKGWWKEHKKTIGTVAGIIVGTAITFITAGIAAPAFGAFAATVMAGTAGGFASTFTSTLINTGDVVRSIGMGVEGGVIGGLTSFALGGILAGIQKIPVPGKLGENGLLTVGYFLNHIGASTVSGTVGSIGSLSASSISIPMPTQNKINLKTGNVIIDLLNWGSYMRCTNFKTFSGQDYHISDIIDGTTIPSKGAGTLWGYFSSMLGNDSFGGVSVFPHYGNAIADWTIMDRAFFSNHYQQGYIYGIECVHEGSIWKIVGYGNDGAVFSIRTTNQKLYEYFYKILYH